MMRKLDFNEVSQVGIGLAVFLSLATLMVEVVSASGEVLPVSHGQASMVTDHSVIMPSFPCP